MGELPPSEPHPCPPPPQKKSGPAPCPLVRVFPHPRFCRGHNSEKHGNCVGTNHNSPAGIDEVTNSSGLLASGRRTRASGKPCGPGGGARIPNPHDELFMFSEITINDKLFHDRSNRKNMIPSGTREECDIVGSYSPS